MEDSDHFTTERIDGAEVCAFAEIARWAGKREISDGRFAAVLDGDDVFAVESDGGKAFVCTAVFTAAVRTFGHFSA